MPTSTAERSRVDLPISAGAVVVSGIVGLVLVTKAAVSLIRWWQGKEPKPLRQPPGPRAVNVEINNQRLRVEADNGERREVPLSQFPRLLNATAKQRHNFQLLGRGIGIYWPDIDEDISVPLLFGSPTD